MLIQRLKDSIKITAGTGAAYLTPEKVTVQREDESEFTVDASGEYDIAQIFIEKNGYTILESEGFTVVYIPNPPKKFAGDDLQVYEHVDVLMVPGERGELVTQLAPPVAIPLDKPEKMAEGLGAELPEKESSLKLRSSSDLPEDTEMVVLR